MEPTPFTPTLEPSVACPPGYVPDCAGDGDCCPEAWIGDGLCDGIEPIIYGCDLTCHGKFGNDGGDCVNATTRPPSALLCPVPNDTFTEASKYCPAGSIRVFNETEPCALCPPGLQLACF